MAEMNVGYMRDRWIPALRSGDYVQGHGALRSQDDRYCCLGVLTDLLVQDGLIPAWDLFQDDEGPPTYAVDGERHYLPTQVRDAIGTQNMMAFERLSGPDDGVTLVELNDAASCSFADIADVIEKTLADYDGGAK